MISRDGKRVAWVELRVNVVFSTIDYRRYRAGFDGSGIEQVAASGGRPFVAFFDTTRILREGLADSVETRPDATTVDQGLCVPDPESEQNGTCGDHGPQAAFDPQVASALPIRELTTGTSDRYPVIFERSGSVRTIGANGGRVKRVARASSRPGAASH